MDPRIRERSLRPARAAAAIFAIALTLLGPRALAAQRAGSGIRGLLTGYAAAGYSASDAGGELRNDFTGLLAPVLLFDVGEDVLLEGEIELGLHDGETLVVLEHIQLHYLGFESVQLRAGRFHLPIGVWNHTNWVNKLPTPPLLYQDTHGEPASGALMPIPFDVGAMGRWTLPVDGWRTSAALWISQGPRPGVAGGHHDEGGEAGQGHEAPAADAPALAWGSNYEDNNPDKMVGLRLRTVSGPRTGLTLQASGFRSRYDAAGELALSGANVSLIWAPGGPGTPTFELRAEGTVLREEFLHHEVTESVRSGGYYVQASRRIGPIEPVVRWSHLPRADAGHAPLVERRRQLALGVIYWMGASVPVKAAFNGELDGADTFHLEWAVGF